MRESEGEREKERQIKREREREIERVPAVDFRVLLYP